MPDIVAPNITASAVLHGIAATAASVVVADAADLVCWASPSVASLLGASAEEILGRPVSALVRSGDDQVRSTGVRQVLADGVPASYVDICTRADGRVVEVEAVVGPVEEPSGRVVGTVTVLTGARADRFDSVAVDSGVEGAQALRFSESLHRAVVANVQEGILATSVDGATILANDRLAGLLGMPLRNLYDRDVRALLGRQVDRGESEMGHVGQDTHEMLHAGPDGHRVVLSVTRSPLRAGDLDDPDDAEMMGALYVVTDVTDARNVEAELRRQALHDPLTGLPNRYLLVDRISMAQARAERSDAPSTTMLFVDLDDFKAVNDGHGHQAGDEVLVEVAHRLKTSVRGSDTVARIGGDEFAILCEETGELGGLLVAERIQDAMRAPVLTGGSGEGGTGEVLHQVRLSIGVAVSPPVGFGALLRLADDAMYTAKQHGGAQTVLSPLVGGSSTHHQPGGMPAT